jgi:far upstream element-binding protein
MILLHLAMVILMVTESTQRMTNVCATNLLEILVLIPVYYRYKDRDDRFPPPRNTGYDDGPRYGRDEPRDWERDRDRDHYRDRERDYDRRDSRRPARYRDRSVSPGPRQPFSPQGKDYEDEMPIDTAHVGMVIGRGGETLRRIERESGARVQFAPGMTSS